MKVYTIQHGKEYRAMVNQGVQYFTLAQGGRKHCNFIVKMFKVALAHHGAELLDAKPKELNFWPYGVWR